MKTALLVGLGADIGATLIGMNDPDRDGFAISAVLTNPPSARTLGPGLAPIHALYARLVLAQPHLAAGFSVESADNSLGVRRRSIQVFWGDARNFDLNEIGQRFDVCILATSKAHIGDDAVIGRFRAVADTVIGLSEAAQIPALYANLLDTPSRFLPNPPRPPGNARVFCLGSCQSNGWHAPLRAILELAEEAEFTTFEIRGMEVDIVHPDTPTGRLGTKSIEPRSQDPRNNLRPSFSQIEMSMNLLFPDSNNLNSVSLRVLVLPPGYQICRFFFRYLHQDGSRLSHERILASFRRTAQRLPDTLNVTELPLGSRAFEFVEASATILGSPQYLRFFDNPFRMDDSDTISELVVQGYVNNVRGYCRSVLNVTKRLIHGPMPFVFYR